MQAKIAFALSGSDGVSNLAQSADFLWISPETDRSHYGSNSYAINGTAHSE